jgi:hypothetical protein
MGYSSSINRRLTWQVKNLSPGQEDLDLAARRQAGERGWEGRKLSQCRGIIGEAGLNGHVFGIPIKVDRENRGWLKRNHSIPGVIPAASVKIVDWDSHGPANDRG